MRGRINVPISAKRLRATLPDVVERVRKGTRFTVIYRSRPAFQIVFRLGLAAAQAWWQQLDGSARLRWERIENYRFEWARHLFFQYRDKDLSFTDCPSFAIMRELSLTTVITTDRNFRQVGFDVLPATRSRRARRPRW